jgi:hypothetical protein
VTTTLVCNRYEEDIDGKERVVSIEVAGEPQVILSADDDDTFGLWFSGLNNVAQQN